jgi:hypothetical protein
MLAERRGAWPGQQGDRMSYDELAAAIDAKNRAFAQMKNFQIVAAKYGRGRVPALIKSGLKRASGDYQTACDQVKRLIAAQQAGRGR